MNKISPIAQFLRANKAKAVNHQSYNSGYPNFKFMQSCDFVDPNGKYIGNLKRSTVKGDVKKGSSYASQEVYVTTFEDGGRKVHEQQVNQYMTYAKIKGMDGQDVFLPELTKREVSYRDEKGNIVTDFFERVISSKLRKISGDKPVGLSGLKPQNEYEALEPIKFTETHVGTTVKEAK